jgi:hypothetical protein
MENKTKKFHVRVWCQASYDSEIEIPANLTFKEACQYAEDHIDEIPLTTLEYLPDSDEIDHEDFDNKNAFYFSNEKE